MEYKIINRNLYISDKWGNLGRKISENVAFGTFDDKTSTFLVTKTDGKVELRDINGTIKRIISNDGIEARFQDVNIILRRKDGKTCIVDRSGNIQRWM